ncbi:ribosome hibernation-promoting factor, HPF/YfiA family [Aquimarina hainanensis]|uniref:Ribosome hibernation-promoting factor, HPF/YfiA family n=1 Tax=Aquimarina hainanensis TaxID=1578017 RepID=A0ABW5N454_9FLAO|nr:ribosome-associated translation inhibitor RaiA [Aquimarina sp. TRL1]QKX04403.1 ribosome-associated translation inhibitor RaiA [Aquimarina sp. TRL1]
MTINIQYVQMATSDTMSEFITKKLEKLGERYDWIIKADVFFKKENDPTGKGKICDIQLSLPGPQIFASSNETSFELAGKETLSDLEKQLKKRKEALKAY